MSEGIDIENDIDDYQDTVCAILGFVNFYRFDDDRRCFRSDVVVFQGRRLARSGDPDSEVTPDFGVVCPGDRGVLGEAKKSFPQDRNFWMDVFRQLANYDDELVGWPTDTERVADHDIVLLTHITRVADVCDFWRNEGPNEGIAFQRPFSIVSFNRSDERAPFFFFQKRAGKLSHEAVDGRLHSGVAIPMNVFAAEYSMVKLYDAEPPVAYMASLIWENVIVPRASEDPKYRRLRRNQKVDVQLDVEDIAQELHTGFSFRTLRAETTEREPVVPKKAWCVRACDLLVSGDLAAWDDPGARQSITVHFRRLDVVLDHMVELALAEPGPPRGQLGLFPKADEDSSSQVIESSDKGDRDESGDSDTEQAE